MIRPYFLYVRTEMALNAAMAHIPVSTRNAVAARAVGGENFSTLLLAVGQDRDKAAFVKLFAHFAPRVKSFLMKGGTSESLADELAQETMLAVWDKAAAFNPAKASASTWIYTIARNKKIDALRKGVRYDLDIDDYDAEDDAPLATEGLMREEEIAAVADALQNLPEEQAELIRQSFFEGKSHSEIADEKKLPLGTVKSRMRLALDRLRKNENIKELWQ